MLDWIGKHPVLTVIILLIATETIYDMTKLLMHCN